MFQGFFRFVDVLLAGQLDQVDGAEEFGECGLDGEVQRLQIASAGSLVQQQ
ncbi:hypothetical protein [Micromonospora sp. NPDC005189]|uniref:hypothetical protein n=1 Tax=unclassified Micromonospora TaxID=2617518 RepID=UPI0033BEEFE1